MKKKYLIEGFKGDYRMVSADGLDEAIDNLNIMAIKLIETENVTDFSIIIDNPLNLCLAESILLLKNTYNKVTLECILPYEHIADSWSENNRNKLFEIFEKCDYERIYQLHPTENCIENLEASLIAYTIQ